MSCTASSSCSTTTLVRCTVYSLTRFAVKHLPLAESITSSLCSLTRPLNKLSAQSPTCPLCSLVWSSVQPRLLAVQSNLFIVQLYHIFVPALTSQLTMYCICTASAAHCPAFLALCPGLLVVHPRLLPCSVLYHLPARFASSLLTVYSHSCLG
jgi:hypothetical protein